MRLPRGAECMVLRIFGADLGEPDQQSHRLEGKGRGCFSANELGTDLLHPEFQYGQGLPNVATARLW